MKQGYAKRKIAWFVSAAIGIVLLGIGGFALASDRSRDDIKAQLATNVAGHCKVGGAPTLQTTRLPSTPGVTVRSPELVVACTRSRWHGSLEIVGFDTSQGFCFTADSPRFGNSQAGACIPRGANWRMLCGGRKICAGDSSWWEGADQGYTQIVGEISPLIDRITVQYKIEGNVKDQGTMAIATLDDALGKRLKVNGRFGVFSVVLPGCPPAAGVEVIGRSAKDGSVVKDHSDTFFPKVCES